jgi:FHS family glucose/mannose:H+ symporter-like MFS transporter
LQATRPEAFPFRNHPAPPFRALFPVFFYFLAGGVATVMLGPLLPALIQHWHIQDAQAGTLFTANFTGQFCGAWFATRNLRASILYGSAVSAIGCAAMAWASFGQAHIALFCVGLGLGAGLTAGNVVAGTAVPSSRARLIALLNVSWGLGAIACPILVRISSNGNLSGIRHFFLATAIFLIATSLVSITIPQSRKPQRIVDSTVIPPLSRTKGEELLSTVQPSRRWPLPPLPLFIFGAAIFLYVGVENSLGGWLPSYAVRTNPSLHASSISVYFWMAELIGRVLVTALMALAGEAALYRICLTLLILAEAALCATAHISASGVIALTVLGALSLAPLYPLIMSFLLARTGNHAKLGALFATASFGGATLPWLTGVLSTRFHGLRAGLLVPATGAALLLFLSTVLTAKPATAPK